MSTLQLSLVGLGSRLTILAAALANTILLARWLGPSRIGEYFLFVKLLSVLATVADLGMSQSTNAFFGRHEASASYIHRTVLWFTLFSWIGTSVVALAVFGTAGGLLLPNFPRHFVWLAVAMLPLPLYANLWNSMMIGLGRIKQTNLVVMLFNVLSLVLTIILIVGLSGGVSTAVGIYVSVMLLQFLTMLAMAPGSKSSDSVPSGLRRQMLIFGIRGYAGSLGHLLWSRIPLFLLNVSHGTAAVGIFSVGQHMAERVLIPVQAVADVAYRKMSVSSTSEAAQIMTRYLRVTWWGMWAAVITGLIFLPWIIYLMLGLNYSDSVMVFRVLLIGIAFMSVTLLLDTYVLNQLHRPGLASIVTWLYATFGLLMAVLLIPVWAESGAALTIVLTQIFGAVVYMVLYLKVTKTHVADLLFVYQDWQLVFEQAGSILKGKGGRR